MSACQRSASSGWASLTIGGVQSEMRDLVVLAPKFITTGELSMAAGRWIASPDATVTDGA
ncbi:MAG: hypothetical protein GDYSWBUE_000564, partial [Candidatus Fervidibacterota bacterium]